MPLVIPAHAGIQSTKSPGVAGYNITIAALARQRKGQVDSTETFAESGFMNAFGVDKLDLA